MQRFSTGLSTGRPLLEKEGNGVGRVDRIEGEARTLASSIPEDLAGGATGQVGNRAGGRAATLREAGSGPKRVDRPATIDDRCGAVFGIEQTKIWVDAKSLVDGGGEIFRRDRCIDRVGGIGVGSAQAGSTGNSCTGKDG